MAEFRGVLEPPALTCALAEEELEKDRQDFRDEMQELKVQLVASYPLDEHPGAQGGAGIAPKSLTYGRRVSP